MRGRGRETAAQESWTGGGDRGTFSGREVNLLMFFNTLSMLQNVLIIDIRKDGQFKKKVRQLNYIFISEEAIYKGMFERLQ